eukprot:3472617-Heterocapsa_arctica.AAC.1
MKNPEAAEFLPAHMLPAPATHGRRTAADSDGEHDDAHHHRHPTAAGPADPWEGWGLDADPSAAGA